VFGLSALVCNNDIQSCFRGVRLGEWVSRSDTNKGIYNLGFIFDFGTQANYLVTVIEFTLSTRSSTCLGIPPRILNRSCRLMTPVKVDAMVSS
jgi:hypothetical protein